MGNKIIKDHLGNEYSTIMDMCKAYNINDDTYRGRIRRGMSVEEALTTPLVDPANGGCEDHLGNKYSSMRAMCKAYNIGIVTFKYRIKNGMSLEEALTTPLADSTKGKTCKDHLGNEYISLSAMCEAYGVKANTFHSRIKSGMSLEEALTTPSTPLVDIPERTDHLGNTYSSRVAMCKAWGMDINTFTGRLASGMSLEEALTIPSGDARGNACKDHLGNEYPFKKAMCDAYGIKVVTFDNRIGRGWTLEDALVRPVKVLSVTNGNACTDHLGNEYPSRNALCRAYNINVTTFKRRISDGLSLEEALTIPVGVLTGDVYKDHLGNEYPSKQAMCKAYNISIYTLKSRLTSGMSLGEALTTPIMKGKGVSYKDHLGNSYPSREAMCKAYGIDIGVYWSRLSRGLGLEETLTTPIGKLNSSCCTDHLGNKYASVEEMCKAYNIKSSVYFNRVMRGMSIKNALTVPV